MKRVYVNYCVKCNIDKLRTNYGYACPKCGECVFLCVAVPFIKNIWLRNKSQHSRTSWMQKRLQNKDVPWNIIPVICNDFNDINRIMMTEMMLKSRNLSKYDYYIIRIISKNQLGDKVDIKIFRDLKEGGIKDTFDNRLFGKVYPKLGWDVDSICPHFLEWKSRQ